MKVVYEANDGKRFKTQKEAMERDLAIDLENCLGGFLTHADAKHLEDFIADTSRVHAVISGILTAVAAVGELDKVEWK